MRAFAALALAAAPVRVPALAADGVRSALSAYTKQELVAKIAAQPSTGPAVRSALNAYSKRELVAKIVALAGAGDTLETPRPTRAPTSAPVRVANLTIGVFGNSITHGAGVALADAWPAQLQAALRAEYGGGVTVVSGAIRASSADFAALCWDEIWGPSARDAEGRGRAPRIDVAVVDYSYTSSPTQIGALLDQCAARGIPALGTLYCKPPDWLGAWAARDAERRGEWTPDTDPERYRHDRVTRRTLKVKQPSPAPPADDLPSMTRLDFNALRWASCGAGCGAARAAATRRALATLAALAEDGRRTLTTPPRLANASAVGARAAAEAAFMGGLVEQLPRPWRRQARRLARRTEDHFAAPDSRWLAARASALAVLLHPVLLRRRKPSLGTPYLSINTSHPRDPGALTGSALENLAFTLLDPPAGPTQVQWRAVLAAAAAAQCEESIAPIARAFAARRVPAVPNYASLHVEVPAVLVDERHPGPIGHRIIAASVREELARHLAECAPSVAAGGDASAGARPPPTGRCLRLAPPPSKPRRARPAAGLDASASPGQGVHDGQTCRLGAGLRRSVVRSDGFAFVQPPGNRTPGLVAERAGAECVLRLTSSTLGAGYLSLALERGHRNEGTAAISCERPCECRAADFDLHATQRYTFTFRSAPRWAALANGTCDVRVRVSALRRGRAVIQALTFSAPLAGNRSVDTNSLYSLLG